MLLGEGPPSSDCALTLGKVKVTDKGETTALYNIVRSLSQGHLSGEWRSSMPRNNLSCTKFGGGSRQLNTS
jgi:hypothetical protein